MNNKFRFLVSFSSRNRKISCTVNTSHHVFAILVYFKIIGFLGSHKICTGSQLTLKRRDTSSKFCPLGNWH